jgi:hypothetical protein
MDVHTLLVPYPECAQFCILLEQFERQVRQEEGGENEYWSFFFRRLRRCRFELCAAPLSANYLERRADDLQHELRQQLTHCAVQYPTWAVRAQDLLERAILLLQKGTLPLLTAIKTLAASSGSDGTAVLIKDARLLAASQEALGSCENLRGVEVVSLADLRGQICYERLIIVGPPRWFPDYVFAAPRAREITVLVYDWIRDHWKLEPAFVRSTRGKTTGWRQVGLTLEGHDSGLATATQITAQDLLPKAQLGDLVPGTGSQAGGRGSHEEVDARGFLLEGDWGVFLEGEAKASALVIALTADEGEPVRRIPIGDIEPGMFVLLRTSGGGDYIVPLADEILGPEAQQVRAYQQEWKERLRSLVAARGLFATSSRLLDAGSTRANEMNVRNWISPRNIRTWDYEDFLAIMRVTGLESEAEEYWSAMGKIVKAHHRAGKQIRDALLDQVRQTDLRKLERLGQMEVDLPGAQSGSLTAYRVEAVLPDLVSVRWNRIGRPFQVGE